MHRPDIFREVAKEMGVEAPREDMKKETLFDGVTFDPAEPEKYAKSFPITASHEAARTLMPGSPTRVTPGPALGLGIAAVVILWALVSQTVAPDLPSPGQDLE